MSVALSFHLYSESNAEQTYFKITHPENSKNEINSNHLLFASSVFSSDAA
ncbi:MAG: hypothetical protein ACI81P_002238 [Neolewinella sp.]|jgi:hypothetical protein